MGLQQRKAGVGGEKFHSPPGLDRGNTSHGCRPLQRLRGCTKEGRWVIYGKELPRNKGTPASRGLGSLTKKHWGLEGTQDWDLIYPPLSGSPTPPRRLSVSSPVKRGRTRQSLSLAQL